MVKDDFHILGGDGEESILNTMYTQSIHPPTPSQIQE